MFTDIACPITSSQTVTASGAWLSLDQIGVALSVPEGAISKNKQENMYVTVVKEEKYRPKLCEGIFIFINDFFYNFRKQMIYFVLNYSIRCNTGKSRCQNRSIIGAAKQIRDPADSALC